MLAVNLNVGDIVLKNGWYVNLEKSSVSIIFDDWGSGGCWPQTMNPRPQKADDTDLWECSFRENDQQTGLYRIRSLEQLFPVDDDEWIENTPCHKHHHQR